MIPLYKPYIPPKLPELNDILHSGNLSFGKWGKLFEDELNKYLQTNYLLTTNTYSSAIQVALTVLGLKHGDEVIASPMACLASNLPLATFGLKIIWADIDPFTGTLDPNSVRNKITSKTKLIIHNHYCGYMGYVDEINAIGKEFGVPVIDDCIEAFGSKYKGKITGNLATDITVFSFQSVRLLCTIDGGAVVFNDKKLFEKAKLVRDFGIDRTKFRDTNNEISSECDISTWGYNATMGELNSYIGLHGLLDINDLLLKQRLNAEKWDVWIDKNMKSVHNLNKRKEVTPNYWVYGFLSEKKMCDILWFREQGYYASGVHLNNNNYSIFGEKTILSGVAEFNSKFVAIPCGWWTEINKFDKTRK
jgi:dTDP-4-amino-4,6-dideoxygalactose transaminase